MQSTTEASPSSLVTLSTSAKRKGGYFPRKFFQKISFPHQHFRHTYSHVFLSFCICLLYKPCSIFLFLILLIKVQHFPPPWLLTSPLYLTFPSLCCFQAPVSLSFFQILSIPLLGLFHFSVSYWKDYIIKFQCTFGDRTPKTGSEV